jgi:hypothetical protein
MLLALFAASWIRQGRKESEATAAASPSDR